MNKQEIMAFFDRCAPEWDRRMVTDNAKIAAVLDAAAVRADHVSREMLPPEALAALFAPFFQADILRSDENIYIVSGLRT